MDLVTQGILGASVGQVGFQKSLGRRALGWGAAIGMLPDLDVLVRFSSNPFAEILYHRGVTHSLWFGPVLGPVLGYLVWRWYQAKGKDDSLSAWVGLMIWALLTHPLLDLFTVYGTQLLAPFSNHRFALSAIPIIDPVYSLTLLASVLVGLFFPLRRLLVTTCSALALILTTGYLFLGLAQNEKAEDLCRSQLATESYSSIPSVKAYTTMFQIFLRRLVVEDNHSLRIGFLSTWAPKTIEWTTFEKPKDIPSYNFLKDPDVAIFTWFTSQRYFVTYGPTNRQITITDNRFGFPGPSLLGLWGVEFEINEKGDRVTPIAKVEFPIGSVGLATILEIFEKAFF
ncbi:metal-dependent hydrolase [Candidatus Finniella inopinata]|uniref:Metal-dependent hydrolase n=1 Tax=Candidatus Finniella inopinata TaxID=1696036 RepID=A0A4Q7DL33_9PROT|nr:metal-dependent hydrolase [Candidatus Finniella inopinata]RZI45406.1 metal-dependent hydrolase [Candidatus Finniella inopinata]